MTRAVMIERILRQIYNGQPADDATITHNLVNVWLNDALALAARQNYKDSINIEGISYVNNSFYSTFKGLTLSEDEFNLWKITLPQIPIGIGQNEGISTVMLKDPFTREISYPVTLMTQNQVTYFRGMREIPNRLLGYPQSNYLYIFTSMIVYGLTATVTMISGGDSTDLDSQINVPDDYFQVIVEYIKQQLMFEKSQPVDAANDGLDAIKTT